MIMVITSSTTMELHSPTNGM